MAPERRFGQTPLRYLRGPGSCWLIVGGGQINAPSIGRAQRIKTCPRHRFSQPPLPSTTIRCSCLPLLSPQEKSLAVLFLCEHSAVFHHKGHALERVDSGQRIALYRDDVGISARSNHAQLSILVQKIGGGGGGRFDGVHR